MDGNTRHNIAHIDGGSGWRLHARKEEHNSRPSRIVRLKLSEAWLPLRFQDILRELAQKGLAPKYKACDDSGPVQGQVKQVRMTSIHGVDP